MLTQKAVSAHTWCPVMLTREDEADNYVVADRSCDPTTESLLRALLTYESDRRVLMRQIGQNRYRAESYGTEPDKSDLWVVLLNPVTPVQVTIREVIQEVTGDRTRTTFRRVLWKKPYGAREEEAESMLRRLIWGSFRTFLPQARLTVETTYAGCDDPWVATHCTGQDAAEAHEWLRRILAVAEADEPPVPLTHHCRSCRWSECGRRYTAEPRQYTGTSRPIAGMW